VIIPARYNGPPDSANGGYAAGMLARYVAAPAGATITLRQPPPLVTPLNVVETDATIEVYDGDRLIASAVPVAAPLFDAVPPVGWAAAMTAAETYPGLVSHPFPTCFVCGPQRPPGDGLRLFPGRLPDGRTATPWIVPEDIEPTLVWAALDCPGGWAIPSMGTAATVTRDAPGSRAANPSADNRPYLLGRISARVDALPAAGDGCVVMGAFMGVKGRKAEVISTVYGADGAVLGLARATWIAIT
jgi:hypothetical protein